MTLTGKVIALTLFIPESRLVDRCAELIISKLQIFSGFNVLFRHK